MVRSEFRDCVADAAEDNGQFVVQLMCGRRRDRARPVGSIQVFHNRMLLPRLGPDCQDAS